MEEEIEAVYGHKVRVRVCGLCWQADRLMLIDHLHLGTPHFWAPPGGGIEPGMTAQEALAKEFLEETGTTVRVKEFLFTTEFIKAPLHAIELFFDVQYVLGRPQAGHDPETKLQLIHEVMFKSFDEIRNLPSNQRHGIFTIVNSPLDLRNLRGYIRLL